MPSKTKRSKQFSGVLAESPKLIRATYDFAKHGGAVGAITLGVQVPAGTVIWSGYLDISTVPTSGGAATIAVHVEGAGDLQAAAAISGAPWSTTGRKAIVPVGTAASSVKATQTRNITVTVAVAALTAGKFDIVLQTL